MNGIRISNSQNDLGGAAPNQVVLDTELETLPIALFGQWAITVYTGYEVGVPPYLQYEVTHNLGYVPLFRGWEEAVVNGETVYRSIPTDIDPNGFLTYISATKNSIFIRCEFAAVQYVGATYRKKGYVYIYEKKYEGLPT
jgi:hypothetical protein